MASQSIPQKQCNACKETFPNTSDHFYKRRASKDGLDYRCKDCAKVNAKQWRDENPERAKELNHEYYLNHADAIKEKVRRWLADNREYALQWQRDYYQANTERAIKNKEWVLANPDKIAAIKQGYIERDPERRRKQARDYNWRNHERTLERGKEWRRNNPEQSRKHHHIRKARILLAPGSFTADDIQRLYEQTDGRCTYCGIPVHWDIAGDIHIDHVQPISRNGSNFPDNLAIACVDCNLSKAVKTLDEWETMRGW